jgi:serine/threonine-protein kinase
MADGARADSFENETRRLLQQRLGLTFGVLSGVSLFYVLSDIVQVIVPDTDQSPTLVTLLTSMVAVVMGLLAWRCRGALRSSRELSLLDAGAMALIFSVMSFSMTQVTPASEGAASLVLGAVFVFMARAVLLPSSGRRTAWLGALVMLPAGFVATKLRVEAFAPAGRTEDWLIQGWLVMRNLGVTIFLAALTSRVIYGLRRQVRENAQLGQYRLREKIGQGGMGAVYRATHALLRRDTAVKVLLPDRVGGAGSSRFEREVKLTAQLTHHNTVAIFDYGRTPDGVFYYAMEYLDGGDLEKLVEYAGPLPPARAVWILEQVCRALAEAHALGLIHRDIKPSNVILCERGREGDVAKICDFGLVKDLNAGSDATLTQNNALTGTPLYLAPESIRTPESVDARADLYSLGALAYFLLTGEPLFSGKTVVEVCAAHLHEAPRPPSSRRAGIPAELDTIVLHCLEKKPEARFADALALFAALRATKLSESWDSKARDAWWAEHREAFRAHCASKRSESLGALRDALRVDIRARQAAGSD